ncbi:MAG: VWA domain-containing protein [Ignavibacteriales bacterium]|nr:VWA domain-containing protein [Ignavibacteriales bacterium]
MGNKLIHLLLVSILMLIISSCSFQKNDTSVTPTPTPSGIVPNSPTPLNGAVNQFLFVTLKWECDNAFDFDIYIGETNPPLIKYATTTNKYFTTPILKYNTRYYWQVIARLNDGTTGKGPIWNFITAPTLSVISNGFAMNLNKIETTIPNNVKITFQVVDLNGIGVNALKVNDFEIFEDYQPLSKTESELTIVNHPIVYNQIRTVLMLDNSTSVESDTNKIKSAARAVSKGIRPNQEIAIYQFSDKIDLLQDFTNDANLLVNAINTKYSIGIKSTDFYGAVVSGTSMWTDQFSIEKIIQGCLVIISDGNDTQGSSSLANAMNAVHNKLVFTIGLGSELQPEILNKLGTGGSFRIGQENEITKQFVILEQSLIKTANSFYDLSYKSPRRGNGNHSLQIRIIGNQFTGNRSTIITTFSSSEFY